MSPRPLPVLNNKLQSTALQPDGHRAFVVPADVSGRFHRRRHALFAFLIATWIALPWLQIGGHPAVFLDIEHRAFHLFGQVFNAQDFWLVFFLASGVGFALIATTALYGRVWCGYACPQTVFLDGVFRRVERWIEGPRNTRLRRDAAGLSLDRMGRKGLKHVLFLGLAFLVAHVVLSYFVSLPNVLRYVRQNPAGHPEAFAWAFAMTAVMYVNFAFFREQLCLIICPYGRLQSVLTDSDTVSIGYDALRGEPRSHRKEKSKGEQEGDCVDCGRCVVVCPTGIDIRNGMQLDCIACTACVDACDDVMARMNKPRGLIRYDSQNGLSHEPRRILRARIFVYAALGAVGMLVASLPLRSREPFESNLLRLAGAPFVLEGSSRVRNALELHLVNKRPDPARFTIRGVRAEGVEYLIPATTVELASLAERRLPVFVSAPNDGRPRQVQLEIDDGREQRDVQAPFIAPR